MTTATMLRPCAVLLLSVLLAWTTPALAQSAVQCAPYQEQTVAMDLTVARQMAASSATAVGDTPIYAKWFGTYSEANAERVRMVHPEPPTYSGPRPPMTRLLVFIRTGGAT